MWIMTSFGIFMPSLRPKEHVPEGDDRKVQIRARRMRELLILKAEYMPEMGEIVFLKHTDYEYRTYCTHAQLADVMARLAMDIDYVKFKQTTDRWNDSKLHNAYDSIWWTLYAAFSTNKVFDRPVRPTRKQRKDAKRADPEYDRALTHNRGGRA